MTETERVCVFARVNYKKKDSAGKYPLVQQYLVPPNQYTYFIHSLIVPHLYLYTYTNILILYIYSHSTIILPRLYFILTL